MGIGLAIPLDKFEIQNVDVSTLSDRRKGGWPKAPRESESGVIRKVVKGVIVKPVTWFSRQVVTQIVNCATFVGGNESYMVKSLKDSVGLVPKKYDHWDTAQWKKNMLLFAKLMDKESKQSFGIATYHMPCVFYAPMVMNIHVDMAMHRTQELATEEEQHIPVILAGDFNLKPSSPEYRMITTGQLNIDDPTYPTPKHGMEWKKSAMRMKSAYAEVNGCEPDFTNYAKVRDEEPFIDVLDYIFLSPEWNVKEVKDVAHRDEFNGPLPTEQEPSDHVLIAANLVLPMINVHMDTHKSTNEDHQHYSLLSEPKTLPVASASISTHTECQTNLSATSSVMEEKSTINAEEKDSSLQFERYENKRKVVEDGECDGHSDKQVKVA